jgi:hypothetical protein
MLQATSNAWIASLESHSQDPNHLLMTTSGFVVKENPYEPWQLRQPVGYCWMTSKLSGLDLFANL